MLKGLAGICELITFAKRTSKNINSIWKETNV